MNGSKPNMIDSIDTADAPQAQELRYLVPHPATWKNHNCCPWATTVLVTDPETDGVLLVPVNCKRWGCEWCAIRKIRRLAFCTHNAEPNRMLTLTVDPELYESPQEAWEKNTDLIPELVKVIRNEPVRAWKAWNKSHPGKTRPCPDPCEFEYLKVTELHKSGWPHWHLLCRSPYIDKKWLSDEWAKLTGAIIVDIRKIHNSFSSFRYLVKYLTKLRKIEWTDRHVSYSGNFFRPQDREKVVYAERDVIERTDEHPWLYLSRRYDRDMIGVDNAGNYHLPDTFCGSPMDMDRAEVGLPRLANDPDAPPRSSPMLPPKQNQTSFIATGSDQDYTTASF